MKMEELDGVQRDSRQLAMGTLEALSTLESTKRYRESIQLTPIV